MREALAAGALLEVYATEPTVGLAAQAAAAGVAVTAVSQAVLAAITQTRSPQGLVGVAGLVDVDLSELPSRLSLVVVLDAVSDPGNAGTVLRTADAAGADAVVLTAGSVDPHSGKVVRAAAGSLWHLPVVSGPALPEVFEAMRARGLQVVATTGDGAHDLHALAEAGGLDAPTAWVFGNEAHGLAEATLAAADLRVRVPLIGRAQSLNLAAAAAVCVYTSARAQGTP